MLFLTKMCFNDKIYFFQFEYNQVKYKLKSKIFKLSYNIIN